MYYVKIPLRHLCEPRELQVPEDEQDGVWTKRVAGLLQDLRAGVIPQWAVSPDDITPLVLFREDDLTQSNEALVKGEGEDGPTDAEKGG